MRNLSLFLLTSCLLSGAAIGQTLITRDVTRTDSQLIVVFENLTGSPFDFELQTSADLESGSWEASPAAVFTPLGDGRFRVESLLTDAQASFVRVVGSATSGSPIQVVINEVMTNNDTALADSEGDFPDWIELINSGETAADLSGYHLSDDPAKPMKWAFPEGSVIPAGGYLTVFASGKEDVAQEGEWHASFKLSNGAEPVILSDPAGATVDQLFPGPLGSDESLGRSRNDPDTLYVFDSKRSTPGGLNANFLFGAPDPFVEAPIFETSGGVYNEPVTVTIRPPHPDDVIRYSTNGEEPIHTLFTSNSTEYTEPFVITEPTVIRAKVLGRQEESRTVTSTYIVGVDHQLPVISMAAAPDNFDPATGYLYGFGTTSFGTYPYSGSNAWKRDREVQTNFEFFEPESDGGFNISVGIKIFGGWGSRGYPQKSLAVFARREYGYGRIRHQLFPDKDIDSFESFVLRQSGNDNQSTWLVQPRTEIKAFSSPGGSGSYFVNGNFTLFRDAMIQSLFADVGMDTQGYRPTAVYLNGDYWGIYNIREKLTEHYVESNHGVPSEEVDVIEGYGSANSGSAAAYSRMRSFISGRQMDDPDNYQTVEEEHLEIDNFIDYHLAVIYCQNFDIGNIKCWRPQADDGRFRWMLYDQDYGFNLWKPEVYLPAMARDFSDYENMFTFYTNPAGNGTGWPNAGGRTVLLRKLLDNDGFRSQFILRCTDLLNSNLTSERVVARIDAMAAVIEPEIPRHLERWSWEAVEAQGFDKPFKPEDEPLNLGHWKRNVEVMREFARARPNQLRGHLKEHFKLTTDPVEVSINVSDPQHGRVQINTLSLDTYPWAGLYFQEYAPTVTAVPNAGYRFVRWEGADSDQETIPMALEAPAGRSVTAIFAAE